MTVVPVIVTVAPLPFGQGGVSGRVMFCALVQLSLAGCAKITDANNKSNKVYNALKL